MKTRILLNLLNITDSVWVLIKCISISHDIRLPVFHFWAQIYTMKKKDRGLTKKGRFHCRGRRLKFKRRRKLENSGSLGKMLVTSMNGVNTEKTQTVQLGETVFRAPCEAAE